MKARRYQQREEHRRVDGLHRAFDAAIQAGKWLRRPTYTPSPEYVQDELRRRRRSGLALLQSAQDFSDGVISIEPNPVVRAAFGVERALDQGIQGLPFNHWVPDCFLDGVAYRSCFDWLRNTAVWEPLDWSSLSQAALSSVRKVKVSLADVAATQILRATWRPDDLTSVATCDPLRPPVEALALVANVIAPGAQGSAVCECEPQRFPSVLGIGLGFAVAAQCLSVLLPAHRVYHLPVPFERGVKTPRGPWQAVFVNIPNARAWAVADLLSQRRDTGYIERRQVLRGGDTKGDDYIIELLQLVIKHCAQGSLLAVMGDPKPYHIALLALVERGFIVPVPFAELDTGKRGVWVDYAAGEVPWAPHRIPRPTGKVVSFWRWTA